MIPKVSVVIPTYGRLDSLRRAIESVDTQTYDNIEIIVVDDDPDRTLPDFETDSPIRIIEHTENRGAPVARNTGITNSTGTYVALLDDDDEWLPQKLDRQVDKLRSLPDSYAMVYSGAEFIRTHSTTTRKPSFEGDILDGLLYSNFIPSATPLIRRRCLDRVGLFDPQLRSKQDHDLWVRIAEKYRIGVLPTVLATIHQDHEDRISTDSLRLYQGMKKFLKKHNKKMNSRTLAVNIHKLGVYSLPTQISDDPQKYFIKSLRHYPLNIPAVLYLIALQFPPIIKKHILQIRNSCL
ncbi:glycosyltransferase [Halorubrum sp. CBA1125]|uniref:glycosyltransferase family 2 protein n=1 Tax=Halorubrum sp. CBA1125 TaxID=2668072 RepID=UPI0012E7F6CF|nr:glycosyltransferase [Halorubrum sp. CBA1125]MUW13218.1 glycosyltransferase [Halorubrum sp. CBA1125]